MKLFNQVANKLLFDNKCIRFVQRMLAKHPRYPLPPASLPSYSPPGRASTFHSIQSS